MCGASESSTRSVLYGQQEGNPLFSDGLDCCLPDTRSYCWPRVLACDPRHDLKIDYLLSRPSPSYTRRYGPMRASTRKAMSGKSHLLAHPQFLKKTLRHGYSYVI